MSRRLKGSWDDLDDIFEGKVHSGSMIIEAQKTYRVVWENELGNKIDMGVEFDEEDAAKDYAEAMSKRRNFRERQILDQPE